MLQDWTHHARTSGNSTTPCGTRSSRSISRLRGNAPRQCCQRMAARKAGRIIFLSSIASWRASLTTAVAYNAAKAGINGLTIGLAKQVEPYGILVNAVAPGPTGTGEPMTAAELEADRKLYPIPIAGAQPIADACLYLAGPGGAWISGITLNVSGGRWHG